MELRLPGLPSPRCFAASLVSALSGTIEQHEQTAQSSSSVAASRNLFLTLHVLFQNELLPALDLLDRGLVTRLHLVPVSQDESTRSREPDQSAGLVLEHDDSGREAGQRRSHVYYVRSGQQQSARSASRFCNAAYEHMTYYEVRPDAWSCSCPAFAFSAFPHAAPDAVAPLADDGISERPAVGWTFGGLTLGYDMPVCKHLLACVLVEHSSMFTHAVEERNVSLEEMAGWAAGWGG